MSKFNPTLLSLMSCLMLSAPAFADTLVGGVQKEDWRNQAAPGTTLSRSDVFKRSGSDRAAQTPAIDQAFDPASFAVPTMAMQAPPPPPHSPFTLNAQDAGNEGFDGQRQNAVPAQQDNPSYNNISPQQAKVPVNPNDPDSTPEMQLAWDAWHHRVAEAIYLRYTSLANVAFAVSPPMLASAAYVVTRDGRIQNVHMLQKSSNPIYNAIILTAINSLNGNQAILQFPAGSRRMGMEKSGTFTQNYGSNQGFITTVNDREIVRGTPQRYHQ